MLRNFSLKAWHAGHSYLNYCGVASARFMSQRKSRRQRNREFLELDNDPTGGFQIGEELEEIEGVAGADPLAMREKLMEHSKKNNEKILRKIIERKYFKPEQEVNLLTWDAKEQIRYLHQEFPDVWTIDKLAESFPSSRTGVIRILNSMWQPNSLNELMKHDKAVQKNWKLLKEAGQERLTSGPVYSRYENLLKEGKLQLLAHADGIPSLPHPEDKIKFLSSKDNHVRTDGAYAAIVKDYCKKEAQKTKAKLIVDYKGSKQVKQLRSASKELITDTVETSLSAHGLQVDIRAVQSELEEHFVEERTAIEKTEQFRNAEDDSIPSVDLIPPYFDSHNDKQSRRQIEQIKMKTKAVKQKNYEEMALAGTGKIVVHSIDENEVADIVSSAKIKSKYAISHEKKMVMDSIQYDEEAYIFSPEKGYEFPFGRNSDIEQHIDLDQRDEDGKLYRKGKNVYDEDGDFLYRIP